MDWISVKDKPVPDDNGKYIVCAWYNDRPVIECGRGWAWSLRGNVTHWMPLPDPPK